MARKWTKKQREEASRNTKARLEAKRKSMTLTMPTGLTGLRIGTMGGGGGGSGGISNVHMLATDSREHDLNRDLYKAAYLLWNNGMLTDRQLLDVTAQVFA